MIPLVSVGFPVYNAEGTIGHALDSILAQEFKDFEIIISDNASTDDTRMVCERYAKKDNRIRYYRNEKNIGVSPNHNRAFGLARGKYFCWIGDDVVFLPGMLGRCVEVIKQAPPSVALVYARCDMVDEANLLGGLKHLPIETRDPRPHKRLLAVLNRLLMVNQLYGLTVSETMRKTSLEQSFGSSDYVLLAELAMLGEIWEIPETLVRRTIDPARGTAAAHRDRKKWNFWVDPKLAGKRPWLSTRQRLALEYFRSAWRLPLRPADKLRCMIAGICQPYGRILMRVTGPSRHWLRNLWGHPACDRQEGPAPETKPVALEMPRQNNKRQH